MDELARLPLITVPSNEGDVVVDLTEDSDDEVLMNHGSHVSNVEYVESVDLSSPVRILIEDIEVLERDGVDGSTRGEDVAPGAFSYNTQEPPLHHHISSNDDDDVILVSSYHTNPIPSDVKTESKVSSPLTPQRNHIIITCPICMETQKNFSLFGHCLVSTKCGHLFCDNCLKKSISLTHKCPTCSSKLNLRQYHRIYL